MEPMHSWYHGSDGDIKQAGTNKYPVNGQKIINQKYSMISEKMELLGTFLEIIVQTKKCILKLN